jgi:HlyD family secretion protein
MSVRRQRLLVAVGAGIAVLALVFLGFRSRDNDVRYQTVAVERGDVVDVVGATGTLQAVTTVQVGSQVSGTIQNLNADFNSSVKKGQVLARLDPSSFEARVGQARANLVSARANVDRARATVEDTKQKYQRAQELFTEKLLPAADLETAKSNYQAAEAQVKANQAAVTQAAAAVNQAQVDLDHTVINAPIDGIVIGRNVDVGQTVAASFQAPVLFVIANDLAHMQVKASIDEADVGRVRSGQEVTFRVDSFPDQVFPARVEQVRLQPTTVQNVVTYDAIISVENPGQRLMPGMTATVSIVVVRRSDVLRVPAAALRFRPEGFTANRPGESTRGASPASGGPGQGPSARAEGDRGASGGRGGEGRARGGAGGVGGPGGSFGRGGNGPGGFGGRASMANGAFAGGGGGDGGGRGGEGRPGLVFVLGAKGEPEPVRIRSGISDGQFVEVRDGLTEGARVVTGVEGDTPRGGAPRPGASSNPFAPQPQRRQR